MDDLELDLCMSQAELGGVEAAAALVLSEIVLRLFFRQSIPERAARMFATAVSRTTESGKALQFLFGVREKEHGGQRKHPYRSQLFETLTIASKLGNGCNSLSSERDERNKSAFVEAARELNPGAEESQVLTEAERMRKQWNRRRRLRLSRTEPPFSPRDPSQKKA